MLTDGAGINGDPGSPTMCTEVEIETSAAGAPDTPPGGAPPQVVGKHCQLTLDATTDAGQLDKLPPIEREIRRRAPFIFGVCLPTTCDPEAIEKGLRKCK